MSSEPDRAAPDSRGGSGAVSPPPYPLPSPPAWVLVVDDHDVFAANLAQTVAAEDDLRMIGTARSVSEARWSLVNAVPDVVVINHTLPDGDAVAAVSELQTIQPAARFLLLTAVTADDLLVRAIEAGVCGFVEKAQSLSALCAAVRLAHAGDAVISKQQLGRLLPLMGRRPMLGPVSVTQRDCDLLVLMADGLTNLEISERTGIGVPAVQLQVATLSAKLGAHSRLEALSVACRQGLLPRLDG